MESQQLSHHILKAVKEFETNLVDALVSRLLEQLAQRDLSQTPEEVLTDEQLCERLQISTSHFYKLKKKHKDFPVIDLGGAKRYKQSEVEQFFKSKNIKQ
ncbi:MAG: hypothetical protein Wins2KO_22280 [Winogradskyella sp.]